MTTLIEFFSQTTAYLPFVGGYILLLWGASIFWIAKDASNRSISFVFQVFAIVLALFPFLGLFIYLLIRPEKTLLEKDFEELFYLLREKGIMKGE